MRENYRNSIASINNFPQFTTMNVIDGQAGLIICASLIFYSLTIDNILNIIVLLLLAGISVSMLTGDNGIIHKAGFAKEQTEIAKEKESIGTAAVHAINKSKFGDITQEKLQQQINNEFGEEKNAKVYEEDDGNFLVLVENRLYNVDKDGRVELSDSNFEFPKREFITQLENNELGVSAEKPYEIKCIEDLLDFSFKVNGIIIENNEITYSNTYNSFNNKFVSLVKNLNFQSELSYENAERVDYGDVNQDGKVDNLLTELTTGKGWICIGGYGETKNGTGFSGTFEGNEKKISNLYINNDTETECSGLFGKANKIKKLTVFGSVSCNSLNAGGICGCIGRNIENCHFTGNVVNTRASSNTGGILGQEHYSGCKIEKCSSKGRIEGRDNVGGIIGRSISDSSSVIDSYNIANIYGVDTIGGISGRCNKIENCYNKGDIIAERTVGGISGRTMNILIAIMKEQLQLSLEALQVE